MVSDSPMTWNHQYVQANDLRIHYVRHGQGQPLVLLHGWPGFWYEYHKNIAPLAEHYDVLVPDLRGFGDTEKTALPDPPARLLDLFVADLAGLLDKLGWQQVGLVSHDVGAYISQAFARRYPERVAGLFFFNCPYSGIGKRLGEPGHLKETWYQYFNQKPWAAELIGSSREACRVYFGNMLKHWACDTEVFAEDLEVWVDNYLKPGNLQGGFNWYISMNEGRLKQLSEGPQPMSVITAPTRVFWGESDPILKAEWGDLLGDYFANCEYSVAPHAGHFVHYEQPEMANREILAFFRRVWG